MRLKYGILFRAICVGLILGLSSPVCCLFPDRCRVVLGPPDNTPVAHIVISVNILGLEQPCAPNLWDVTMGHSSAGRGGNNRFDFKIGATANTETLNLVVARICDALPLAFWRCSMIMTALIEEMARCCIATTSAFRRCT